MTGKLDVRDAAALLPEEVPAELDEDDIDLSLIDPEGAYEEAVVV